MFTQVHICQLQDKSLICFPSAFLAPSLLAFFQLSTRQCAETLRKFYEGPRLVIREASRARRHAIQFYAQPILWGGGGDRGGETGRKGGGRCTGGGRRGGGKRDSPGSGKREKKGRITQHCAIFRNRKNAERREPTNTGREPGLKGTGSGRFKPPCTPPTILKDKNFSLIISSPPPTDRPPNCNISPQKSLRTNKLKAYIRNFTVFYKC